MFGAKKLLVPRQDPRKRNSLLFSLSTKFVLFDSWSREADFEERTRGVERNSLWKRKHNRMDQSLYLKMLSLFAWRFPSLRPPNLFKIARICSNFKYWRPTIGQELDLCCAQGGNVLSTFVVNSKNEFRILGENSWIRESLEWLSLEKRDQLDQHPENILSLKPRTCVKLVLDVIRDGNRKSSLFPGNERRTCLRILILNDFKLSDRKKKKKKNYCTNYFS